jgi:hypothetical protein
VYLEDSPRATLFYDMLRSRAGMILLGDSSGPCLGSADRLLGSLATLAGQWDVAQRHFDAALATEAATGRRVWQAHGRYRYAWMLERRDGAGDRTRAHRLAADALDDATALGMQALAPRVQALLEKLGMP